MHVKLKLLCLFLFKFKFFGMPLPSLSSLWSGGIGGGQTSRKSNSRVDVDPNGKSRLRNFRPRPGEILESFQFSNNVHLTPPSKPTPATIMTDKEPTNIHPPPPANSVFVSPNGYFPNGYSDARIEKGGFIPILPGRNKGYFTPIQNPFSVSNVNSTEGSNVQETVSTELRPNNLEFNVDALDDIPDNKYPVLVPTVNADFAKNYTLQNPSLPQPSSSSPRPQAPLNVSTLRKGEIVAPTKSSNGIHLIRSTAAPPRAATVLTTKATTTSTTTTTAAPPIPISTRRSSVDNASPFNSVAIDRFRQNESPSNSAQKKFNKTQKLPALLSSREPEIIIATTPFYPTFSPHANDVINLSKNRSLLSGLTAGRNGIASGSALSALVAPGAQQGIFRPSPGRTAVITKVFNNTLTGTSSTSPPTPIPFHSTSSVSSSSSSSSSSTTSMKSSLTSTLRTTTKLPTAEEYLRTTSQDNIFRESTTSNSHFDTANDLEDQATQYKGDMNWYFNNYNRSSWKEPHHDSSLYRFRTHSTSSCRSTSSFTYFTITITFTLILATQFF